MSSSPERINSFLDDPVRTSGAVTIGAAAIFAVVHEMVPTHFQDAVKVLAVGDLFLNAASWQIIRQNLHKSSADHLGGVAADLPHQDAA